MPPWKNLSTIKCMFECSGLGTSGKCRHLVAQELGGLIESATNAHSRASQHTSALPLVVDSSPGGGPSAASSDCAHTSLSTTNLTSNRGSRLLAGQITTWIFGGVRRGWEMEGG